MQTLNWRGRQFRDLRYPINTGWQSFADNAPSPGGIVNMVTNGTFDSDTTGWTATNNATLSSVAGELHVTGDGVTNFADARQTIAAVAGESWTVTGRFRRLDAGSVNVSFVVKAPANVFGAISNTTTTMQPFQATFTVPGGQSSFQIVLFLFGNTGTAVFDDIVAYRN